jgi:hypothetical protein
MALFIIVEEKRKPWWYNEPDSGLKHPNHWSIAHSAATVDPEPT